jgi:hypothetical protein
MSHPQSPVATHLPEAQVDAPLTPPRHANAACPPTPAKRRYVPVDELLKATVQSARQLLTAAQHAHRAYLQSLAESVADAVRSDVANGLLPPPLENPAAIEDALAAHAHAAAHQCYLLEFGDRETAMMRLVLAEYAASVDYAGAIYLGIRKPLDRDHDRAVDGAALLIRSHANQTCRRLGMTAKVRWFDMGVIAVRDEILQRVARLADGTPKLYVRTTSRMDQRRFPIWVGEPKPQPTPLPPSRRKRR